MELMSCAFLCVLVALLPQTLGGPRNKNAPKADNRLHDNSLLIRQNPMLRKTILININGPPLVSNVTELQSVFNDLACSTCKVCMERAIKAHSAYLRRIHSRPSNEDLREDVLTNEIADKKRRIKRDAVEDGGTTDVTPRKAKGAKKTIKVTKYNVEDKVYALKVKETQMSIENQNLHNTTCQIYRVKQSFPCESPEGVILLSSATKRRANRKKPKKTLRKNIASTTAKPHTALFKKREVEDPENFMPSIEDVY